MLLLLSTKFRTETGLSWPPVVKRVELLKAVYENALLFGMYLCAPLRKAPGVAGKKFKETPAEATQWPQTLHPSSCKVPLWIITNFLACVQMQCCVKSISSH